MAVVRTVTMDTMTSPRTPRRDLEGLDFEVLYRATQDSVFAYVATLLRDRGAAEDVTRAAFERAVPSPPLAFDAGRGTCAWLFGIARRRSARRAARRSGTRSADDPSPSPAARTSWTSACGAPPCAPRSPAAARDREIVALKFHAGLDNGEIAERPRPRRVNTGTRLHRAPDEAPEGSS